MKVRSIQCDSEAGKDSHVAYARRSFRNNAGEEIRPGDVASQLQEGWSSPRALLLKIPVFGQGDEGRVSQVTHCLWHLTLSIVMTRTSAVETQKSGMTAGERIWERAVRMSAEGTDIPSQLADLRSVRV